MANTRARKADMDRVVQAVPESALYESVRSARSMLCSFNSYSAMLIAIQPRNLTIGPGCKGYDVQARNRIIGSRFLQSSTSRQFRIYPGSLKRFTALRWSTRVFHKSAKREAPFLTSFVFRRQMTVERGHSDPAGVVFNSRFFEYFDINTWMLLEAAVGIKRQDLAATFGILGFPLVGARADFLKPVKFGDVIEIASRVTEFRRSSFDVEHRITIDGDLAVDGGESRVWAVRNKNDPDKLTALAIPSEVVARFL
jgi:4-hydroxybenzoyl-CoA thioesterase